MHIVRRGISFAFLALAAPAQDFIELPWRVSEQGQLEVRTLTNGVGASQLQFSEWQPMFPGLFERSADGEPPGLHDLVASGPFLALPLLVHGAGGAAALDEATIRLRKLSLGVTVFREALIELRPDPLVDLLRVRHLASCDVATAAFALGDYAKDPRHDAFVRAAAAEAYCTSAYGAGWPKAVEEIAKLLPKRNGASALQAALTRLPDDADLVLGLHSAALPSAADLLAAWRVVAVRSASSIALAASSSISPEQYTIGQLIVERPGQLPYELATRFGNWRVDHALFALRHGDADDWWLHLGGVFLPQRVAEGLREAGGEVRLGADGDLRATIYKWQVRATATELEAWSTAHEIGSRGAMLPALHDRAAPGQAPAWLVLPATSRLGAQIDAAGCSLDVRLQIVPRALTATAVCPDAAQAGRLLAKWHEWQRARRCDPDDKVPGETDLKWRDLAGVPPGVGEDRQTHLFWRRCVQAVRATRDGARVQWSIDLAPFALDDLVRLLGASPVVFLRDA